MHSTHTHTKKKKGTAHMGYVIKRLYTYKKGTVQHYATEGFLLQNQKDPKRA